MTSNATAIGQNLWNYCNDLREVWLSYWDYLEHLTNLKRKVAQSGWLKKLLAGSWAMVGTALYQQRRTGARRWKVRAYWWR